MITAWFLTKHQILSNSSKKRNSACAYSLISHLINFGSD